LSTLACPRCDSKSVVPLTLTFHPRSSLRSEGTGGNDEPEDPTVFRCEICHATFRWPVLSDRHEPSDDPTTDGLRWLGASES
jgi:hypothetical protein